MEKITKTLQILCDISGYSHYLIAKKACLSQSTVGNVFNRESISLFTLISICQGFDITLTEFCLFMDFIDTNDDWEKVVQKIRKERKYKNFDSLIKSTIRYSSKAGFEYLKAV